MDFKQIVKNTISYCIDFNTNIKLEQEINNNLKLTDYQFFTAKNFILNNYLKTLLVYYETGKGKTLLTLYISKNIYKIYSDWSIILLCKASLIETPWLETIKKIYPELQIYIFSFDESNLLHKINAVIINTSRVLFIIDEVHIFISRCIIKDNNKDKPLLKIYNKIKSIINLNFNHKMLLLTATPIVNDIEEFLLLTNLINPNYLPTGLSLIEKDKILYENEIILGLIGKISYNKTLEVSSFENTEKSDRIMGKKVHFIYLTPTDFQEYIYLNVDKKEKKSVSRGFRMQRNIACQFVYLDMDKDIDFEIDEIKNFDESLLKNHSIKFYEVCKMILKTKGKVLLFESFIEFGINILKIYFDFFKITYLTFTGEEQTQRYENLKLFEDEENKNGLQYKVFMISTAAREGLSFKYITDFFILSSSWNETSLNQIIGRAIRLDSHKDMNLEYVNIYFLQLKLKNSKIKTADEEIFDIMLNKYKVFSRIYLLLKKCSLEYIDDEVKTITETTLPDKTNFKLLYNKKFDINKKFTNQILKEELVEPIYYTNDNNFNIYYTGYKKNNLVYNSEGILIGELTNKNKIVNKKIVYLIKLI